MDKQHLGRLLATMVLAFFAFGSLATLPAVAETGERTLYLHHTHRDDTVRITFKRNGVYDQKGLAALNYFLRDWRTNDQIKMDPALFDLVWQVYQAVGATQPINIVSSYRSPKTNAMLRQTSSGVAENSQHMKGHAMDFFIPGVDLSVLRATAMRYQVGGVGFYPTSGSPFVHLDTGSVRAWPRMTKAQLQKVFPDGRTLHLPTDGKPLSSDGRQYAQSEWTKCHMVPCGVVGGGNGGGGKKTTLMDMITGNGAPVQVASAPQSPAQPPSPAPVSGEVAPMPMNRPTGLGAIAQAPIAVASLDPAPAQLPFSTVGSAPLDEEFAPVPALKSARLALATTGQTPTPADAPQTAVAMLDTLEQSAPVPASRVLMSPKAQDQASQLVTAYVPDMPQDASAQKALEMIIARNSTPKPEPVYPAALPASRTALASTGGFKGVLGLMDNAINAVSGAEPTQSVNLGLPPKVGPDTLVQRSAELVAPDLDHVTEVFMTPAAMSSAHYAVIFDHDEANLDPSTELGRYATEFGRGSDPSFGMDTVRFSTDVPALLASR